MRLNPAFFVLLLFCLLLSSCSVVHVADNRNLGNAKEIGVDWTVRWVSGVGADYPQALDSLIDVAIKEYNRDSKIHFKRREAGDSDYITLQLKDFKVVGHKEKVTGGIITALGAIALPFILTVANSSIVFGFGYIPRHELVGKVQLSAPLGGARYKAARFSASKRTLFGNNKKQVPILYNRFIVQLHTVFDQIENNLKNNKRK